MKKGVDYIGVGTGALVFNGEGKVLITKRGPEARNEAGKWEFPGGEVEYGEKCEDAVVREVREEVAVEIEVLELLQVVDHIIPEEGQHWVALTYIARWISGAPQLLEPHKISDFKWVEISGIDPVTLSIASRHNILAFRAKYGNQLPPDLLIK